MGFAKWEGAVAVVRATSASHAPSTGYQYPDAEEVSLGFKPVQAERVPAFFPDTDTILQFGHEGTWSIGNVRPNCRMFGYLLALGLGTSTYTTGTVQVLPSDDLAYANVLADYATQIGSTATHVTARALGAMVSDWTLEQQSNQLAALSLSGRFCNLGTATDVALVPTIPTGTNEAPLSWLSLRAGTFTVAIGSGTLGADSTVTGFRLGSVRGLTETGRGELGQNQPTGIRPGKRALTLDVMKEFSGTAAQAQYAAWIAQDIVKVQLRYTVGTNYVQSGTMVGKVIDSFPGNVGAGEDIIQAALKLKLYKDGTAPILSWTLVDGSTAAYW